MSDYQVIARKFRPQTFKEVIGQDAIVKTLKNAIKFKRLAQAYLFCGSRGTGKTTLARLFAKALNCQRPSGEFEPCNQCNSCREISVSSSLDVLEIDGASHRGIEDIRQINETVGYATATGGFKIYIIDEVHMLTKEAFNALLKTLEEPPPKVKFFFATTEPHKVLPTILSRCQRFNLNRIPLPLMVAKLQHIAQQLNVEVEEEALHLLAQRAEGGLRDAESLFDQILTFEEGPITLTSATTILGLMPRETYFEIDQAGKNGNFIKAFEIAQHVFSEGKDLNYFIEGLIDHLRHILIIKVSGVSSPYIHLSKAEKEKYEQTAALYSQEQCLDLIEYLLESQNQLRMTTFVKTSLETILLHVMRSHFRLPIEQVVRHLSELEHMMEEKSDTPSLATVNAEKSTAPLKNPISQPKHEPITPPINKIPPVSSSPPPLTLSQSTVQIKIPLSPTPSPTLFDAFVSIDPTPTPADFGKAMSTPKQAEFSSQLPTTVEANNQKVSQHEYDTLFYFAAVELEGKLQKY